MTEIDETYNAGEMSAEERLRDLAVRLYRAKKAEEQAKEARIAVEEEILGLVAMPEKGSRTFAAGEFKLACKTDLTYLVDERGLFSAGLPDEAVRSLFDEVPASLKFNSKQYEALRTADPAVFAEVAKYVCTKPKKPSVAIKI